MFACLPVRTITCLLLPDCTFWNTFIFSHSCTLIKSFSAAKESHLFEVTTMFLTTGRLWLRVAPVSDIQLVIYSYNFVAVMLRSGLLVAF